MKTRFTYKEPDGFFPKEIRDRFAKETKKDAKKTPKKKPAKSTKK